MRLGLEQALSGLDFAATSVDRRIQVKADISTRRPLLGECSQQMPFPAADFDDDRLRWQIVEDQIAHRVQIVLPDRAPIEHQVWLLRIRNLRKVELRVE